MSELPKLCSCEKIFEFWGWCWYPSHNFVAADAGKQDAISLRRQTRAELRGRAAVGTGIGQAGVARNLRIWFERVVFLRILRARIDVPTDASALFFNFCEIGALIPVGFGVVVVGDGVEARSLGDSTRDDGIGHTDDGGRVPAAAQFSQDGAIRAEAALDGLGEYGAEV